MLLGIPYHAALIYAPDQHWLVDESAESAFLGHVADIGHGFRMQIFFMLAGMFSAMILARRLPGVWLKSRLIKLGIPLLTGLLLISPFQLLVARLGATDGVVAAQALSFGDWIAQFWFLIVLILLSVMAAALAAIAPSKLAKLSGWAAGSNAPLPRLAQPLVVAAIGLAIGIYAMGVGLLINGQFETLVRDSQIGWTLMYLPYFVLGAAAFRIEAIFSLFTRFNWLTAAFAPAGWTAYLAADSLPHANAVHHLASAMFALGMAHIVLSLCFHFFDRPSPRVRETVDAAFVIYMVHHPLVVIFGLLLTDITALPPLVKFSMVVVATGMGSAAIWLGVKRVPLLMLLLNGQKPVSARKDYADVRA